MRTAFWRRNGKSERDVIADAVDDGDVAVTCRVSVAPRDEDAETVLRIADETACDHLFVYGDSGRRPEKRCSAIEPDDSS